MSTSNFGHDEETWQMFYLQHGIITFSLARLLMKQQFYFLISNVYAQAK